VTGERLAQNRQPLFGQVFAEFSHLEGRTGESMGEKASDGAVIEPEGRYFFGI
jgi:hypothetical protein